MSMVWVVWPGRSAIGYLKWGHLVADLDSGALALTKEVSGNSCAQISPV